MKWKSRQREILKLKAKLKGHRYHVPLPDLSCNNPHSLAPCGNQFAPIHDRAKTSAHHPDANPQPIGNPHKSGLILVTPGMIANGELKYLGGKKF